MNRSSEAVKLVELGNKLSDAGRQADAEGAYGAAAKAGPAWSVPFYNLGLLYKYQARWAAALELNRRAVELDPNDRDAWWNVGIAATAISDWKEARRAWRECGITLAEGVGPPDGNFGPVPVRLDPLGQGEVVWAHRIDPARARLENIPLPTSSFRWADVVLHDGAAEGYRRLDGRERPVFNVLSRLVPSGFLTFVLELGTSDDVVIGRLENIARQLGGAAENWGSSTNILCRACSFGVVHEHSGQPKSPAHQQCGIAALSESHATEIVGSWLRSTPGADFVRMSLAPNAAA